MPLRKCFTLTPARIEANRRNAQESIGPRTPQGKDKSRMNGLRNGVRFPLYPGLVQALFDVPPCAMDKAKRTPIVNSNTPVDATMFMKMQGLRGNSRDLPKMYITDDKWLIEQRWVRCQKKGELKNEGRTHDVYENKGRVNGHFDLSHDVHENKVA